MAIAVEIETELVGEKELEEEKLVEIEELLETEELLEKEELIETEENADCPCMFLRYGHPHGPLMVVTTCDPSSVPLNKPC